MNLANLRTEAQRLANRVDQDFNTRTRRWLNEAYEEWSMSIPWPTLIKREDLVSRGQAQLILPPRIRVVRWVGDPANKRIVRPNDYLEREYEASFFNPQTSDPFFYRERGLSAVTTQPSSATNLVFNTTVSDAFTAYVSGLAIDTRVSGTADYKYQVSEMLSMGGTTNAQTANQYIEVFTVGKDDFTAADLLCWNSSDVISRVNMHRYRSEYRQIEFLHTPPAGTLLRVEYLVAPESLIEDWQIPHPGVDTEYLINYAAAKIHTAQNRPELAAGLMAEATAILNRRIYQERAHKENDLRALPDPLYQNEDTDIWSFP